jgi:phosphatidylcholine synthase
VTLAWLAHLYTAAGAVMGFLAAAAVTESNYRSAFRWLFISVVIDATDGMLARRARVTARIPWIDGALLDNIVDYLTYVFVPALIVWQALLVPAAWAAPICGGILLSSAYGFSRVDAKTEDHFFTGFPSYWNIVVFYLFVAGWSPLVNAAILIVLTALVFVPIRYIYPSRTPVLRPVTVVLGTLWAVAMLVLLWQAPPVSRPLFWGSLVFPAYYAVLSVVLHAQSRRPGPIRG